jgi:hypothetical protein
MRAALPAAANALIASSSVRGARYRISAMVVLRLPYLRAHVDGPCCRRGEPTWAKTIGIASWVRSSGSAPMRRARLCRLSTYCVAPCVPLNPAKHAPEAPTRFHPFAMALKKTLTQSNKAVQISARVGLTGCFPNTVCCTESTKRT